MYIGLLAMGFLLMWVEAICLCAKREMNALKINAFAAMCTVLSGGPGGHLRSPGGSCRRDIDFDTSVTYSAVIRTRGLKGHLLFYFLHYLNIVSVKMCLSPKV